MNKIEIWLRGMLAAAISGAAGGVLTGFAGRGDRSAAFQPQHGNGYDDKDGRGRRADQRGDRASGGFLRIERKLMYFLTEHEMLTNGGTAVTYSTAYALGTDCTVGPSYAAQLTLN